MASRLDLHNLLVDILGSSSVYFQPPETIKMSYPAIVYSLDDINTRHANDEPYLLPRAYAITLIHKNPDNEIVEKIAELPLCRFGRFYVVDNLNHYTFTLYY